MNVVDDPFTFDQVKNKSISHKVIDLKNQQNNTIELKCILVEFIETFAMQNNQRYYRFRIADETGSIICNFFEESASQLEIGDIVYLNGFTLN